MIFVVTYENLSAVQKVVFPNGATIDIFPAVQEMIYSYRQVASSSTEAGGMLVGYENVETGNFTVANATEPQPLDVRTRISLVLRGQHREYLRKLHEPYGYASGVLLFIGQLLSESSHHYGLYRALVIVLPVFSSVGCSSSTVPECASCGRAQRSMF